MRARRFEEVLEECITAHLEGRRTIEESLSLYPSLARELEPDLRTAARVAGSFQFQSPPDYVLERGRHRFLLAASTRARARALTARLGVSEHRSRPWGMRVWGFVGAAAAVVVVAAALTAITLTGGDGAQPTSVSSTGGSGQTAPAVLIVESLRGWHEQVKSAASHGGEIEPGIGHIRDATARILDIDPSTLPESDLEQFRQTIQDQYILLHNIAEATPADQPSDEVRGILGSTEELAAKWGVTLPVFSPLPVETPAPATPAETPVETPAPTLPPIPTPEATPAPATPAPTDGPADQGSPIFQPS